MVDTRNNTSTNNSELLPTSRFNAPVLCELRDQVGYFVTGEAGKSEMVTVIPEKNLQLECDYQQEPPSPLESLFPRCSIYTLPSSSDSWKHIAGALQPTIRAEKFMATTKRGLIAYAVVLQKDDLQYTWNALKKGKDLYVVESRDRDFFEVASPVLHHAKELAVETLGKKLGDLVKSSLVGSVDELLVMLHEREGNARVSPYIIAMLLYFSHRNSKKRTAELARTLGISEQVKVIIDLYDFDKNKYSSAEDRATQITKTLKELMKTDDKRFPTRTLKASEEKLFEVSEFQYPSFVVFRFPKLVTLLRYGGVVHDMLHAEIITFDQNARLGLVLTQQPILKVLRMPDNADLAFQESTSGKELLRNIYGKMGISFGG